MPFSLRGDGHSLSQLFNSNESNSDHLIIERQNLICVFKLVIKDLLSSSLNNTRLMETECFPLKHFFIVFEHMLLHGYKGKRTFSISSASNRKDLSPIIDLISRKLNDTQASDTSTSSKEMTNVSTPIGRTRAWLRLALIQKRLADYFIVLIEYRHELHDLYDNEALLLSEEGLIIPGLLVGLNVLEFNLCLREMSLDLPTETTIYYSLYLRERRFTIDSQDVAHLEITHPNDETSDVNESAEQRISRILDQKHYIEERYRNLEQTVSNLRKNATSFEQRTQSLTDTISQQKIRIEQLEEESGKLKEEKEQIQTTYQRKIDVLNGDIEVERETFKKSRAAFEMIYTELQQKYANECAEKQQIENDYQTQLSKANEFKESAKIMEKDVEIKTLLHARVNSENELLTEKLKSVSHRASEQEHQIQLMEAENQMLRKTINELEANIERTNKELQEFGRAYDEMNDRLTKITIDKASLENDLRTEKEAQERLKKALIHERERVSTLQFDIHDLTLTKQEYDTYKQEMTKAHDDLQKKYEDQERAITELASKLEPFIMNSKSSSNEKFEWMPDENARECCLCRKEFNTRRRKHHCRKCGRIFCETCTTAKLVVNGSAKPERVCDNCRDEILSKCAVNSS